MLDVATNQHFSTFSPTHSSSNLSKLADLTCRFILDPLGRHTIAEHPAGIVSLSREECRLLLVSDDNGLLDIPMDGRVLCTRVLFPC